VTVSNRKHAASVFRRREFQALWQAPTRRSRLAVAAVALCLVPITFPAGALVGLVALLRIRRRAGLRGTGLVLAGLALGGLLAVASMGLLAGRVSYCNIGILGGGDSTQARLSQLARACEDYYTDFDAYPTIFEDPPETRG